MDAAYTAYREIRIEENRKRRLRIVRRQRIILALVIALIVFAFAFLGCRLVLSAHSENARFKYYTSITIHSGDTLSSIADDHISPEYKNADSYIREVCAINGLDEDGKIYAGENLVIPYYSEEFK